MGPIRSEPVESGVRSIDRTVAILTAFRETDRELGISELARRTGLATSTTQRLLIALQVHDLVRQTPSGRYRLGGLLNTLAGRGIAGHGLRTAARPHLVELRNVIDETVAVHEFLPPGQRVVLDQAESHQELRRTYTDIGIPSSVVHGAPGKAIMCCLSDGEVDSILAVPIPRLTAKTVVDSAVFRDDLARSRAMGYATSDGERTAGIGSLASPVFDASGRVVGSANASVPQSRLDPERMRWLGENVRRTAWAISEDLGADRAAVTARMPDLRLG